MVNKTCPIVTSQQPRMLRYRGRYHEGLYCEGTRELIGAKQLDAQVDAHQILQRDRLVKTTPGSRGAFPFARDGCGPDRESMLSNKSRLMKVCGEPVSRSEERHATKRRESLILYITSPPSRDPNPRSCPQIAVIRLSLGRHLVNLLPVAQQTNPLKYDAVSRTRTCAQNHNGFPNHSPYYSGASTRISGLDPNIPLFQGGRVL